MEYNSSMAKNGCDALVPDTGASVNAYDKMTFSMNARLIRTP